jgi:cytochrome P450
MLHVLDENQLSYDPYNVEIDTNPYPTYKRLRDEAPLYYNETFDFWGLSRFADVEAALRDVENLSSASRCGVPSQGRGLVHRCAAPAAPPSRVGGPGARARPRGRAPRFAPDTAHRTPVPDPGRTQKSRDQTERCTEQLIC